MAKSSQIFLCCVIQTFMDQESKFDNVGSQVGIKFPDYKRRVLPSMILPQFCNRGYLNIRGVEREFQPLKIILIQDFSTSIQKEYLSNVGPLIEHLFSQRIALHTELEFHRLLCCRPEQFTSEDNSIVVKHLNIDSIPKHWPEDIYKVVTGPLTSDSEEFDQLFPFCTVVQKFFSITFLLEDVGFEKLGQLFPCFCPLSTRGP